jgi:hypothetical protein
MKHRTKRLPSTLEHRLRAYAAAAGAAGVGALALASPAQAKIIYTSANIPIGVNAGPVELDLNHDGINDFQFYNGYQGPGNPLEGNHSSALAMRPTQPSNRVWAVHSNNFLCAAAVPKGENVGPHRPFQPGNSSLNMAFAWGNSVSGGAGCPWLNVKRDYLGLKFMIKGKVHFGWARVKMGGLAETDYITGYAYETIANRPIVTGKTKGKDAQAGGLGVLAAGTVR